MSISLERTSATTRVGLAASFVVVLGILLHRNTQVAPAGRSSRDASSSQALPATTTKLTTQEHEPFLTIELGSKLHVRQQAPSPPLYVRPIAEYLGIATAELCRPPEHSPSKSPKGRDAGKDDAVTWVERWGPRLQPHHPEFLIAAIPDPEQSRSGFRFDMSIEARQRAASAADSTDATYVLDRYFLPWRTGIDDDLKDSHVPESFPGVLVFRSLPSSDVGIPPANTRVRLLVVFLIGDTPTGGLHKRALRVALDVVAWFQLNEASHEAPELKLVAPVFSGSQTSLQTALQAWWTEHPTRLTDLRPKWRLSIVSTATAVQHSHLVPEYTLSNGKKFLEPTPAAFHFSTTNIPDEVLSSHLLDFLRAIHPHKRHLRIAHLRESTTGFGASSFSIGQPLATPFDQDGNPLPVAEVQPALEIIDVPFPLHISQVHARHDGAAGATDRSAPQLRAAGRSLRIPTDEKEGSGDTIPQLNQSMTVVFQDKVLSAALQTLAKQECHYILITATDPRDTIFLASVVATNCPDTRVLLTLSDQLYTHAEYVRYLAGAYVASSYPLSPLVTDQAFSGPKRQQLTSFGEQLGFAYYNAIAIQLDKHKALQFYRKHSGGETPVYGPNVWLSQIGHDKAHVLSDEPPQMSRSQDVGTLAVSTSDDVACDCVPAGAPHYWWPLWLIGVIAIQIAVAIRGRQTIGRYAERFIQKTAVAITGRQVGENRDTPGKEHETTLPPPIPRFWWPLWLIGILVSHRATTTWRNACMSVATGRNWLRRRFRRTSETADREQLTTAAGEEMASAKILAHRSQIAFIAHWLALITLAGAVGYVSAIEGLGRDIDRMVAYSRSEPSSPGDQLSAQLLAHVFAWCACILLVLQLGYDCWRWWCAARRLLRVGVMQRGAQSAHSHAPASQQAPGECDLAAARCFIGCAVSVAVISGVFLLVYDGVSPDAVGWQRARTMDVLGWLSPVVPLCEIAGVILCWCWLQRARLDRLSEFEAQWDTWSQGYDTDRFQEVTPTWWAQRVAGILQDNKNVMAAAGSWYRWPLTKDGGTLDANWYMIAGGAFVLCGVVFIVPRWLSGPDGLVVQLCGLGMLSAGLLIAWEIGRAWHIWTTLERLHRHVSRLPIENVISRLPDQFVRSYGDLFFVERYRSGNTPSLTHQLHWVLAERERQGKESPFTQSAMEQDPSRAEGKWVRQYIRFVLPEIVARWSIRPSEAAYPDRESGLHKTDATPAAERAGTGIAANATTDQADQMNPDAPQGGERKSDIVAADERLFAMMVVVFVSQYRLQLKALALFLVAAPILLLLASASYPFEPQRLLMDFAALMVLLCLVVLLVIYSGLNRDEFLSCVNGTMPRWYAISPDSLATFFIVFLPLMLTLASTLPGGEIVYSWVSSIVDSVPLQR
ncbi:MAG: hypothetical protein HY290_10230 [Planctomycetia bacterium]|nr:hypothetical protein [Planctomycetia bacterium]